MRRTCESDILYGCDTLGGGGGGGDKNKWSHMFFFPDYPIVERELPIVYQKLIVIQNIISLSNSTL